MSKIKILVVDDDEKILYAFRKVLEKTGYTCIEARNGREALEKFTSEQPHAVFLDYKMPDMDGLEALRQIKSLGADVPLIMISGHDTPQAAAVAKQLGAFEYLTKPLPLAKIREVMQQALTRERCVTSAKD